MLKRILAASLLVAVFSHSALAYDPKQLSNQAVAAIYASVQGVLKDPGSAQFGLILAGPSSGGTTLVCGYVNARNSFGGYTGMTPFNGMLLTPQMTFVVTGIGDGEHQSAAILKVCHQRGLPI